ncbi:transcriptional regulator [Paenibacillus sp. H1-7]|uniref:helix-turn-helix domain-containing protein n=1 Tax=Paenibacillus sp. H1-7 TaxID=2282849 RepID=UPI001EF84E21|nr:helix-turn-helix domain-containing protein [Paenibacillus sp. H1-7]ULL13632.1 transcriptional regulator [Paenibacillus sp. H1-7]
MNSSDDKAKRKSKAELLLHPVRLKIIQSLIGRQLTIQQLNERMPETPQATLYRQVKLLQDSGLLRVVEHHQVRGTVERVFALAEFGADLTPDDMRHASREQHMQLFMQFIALLLGDYGAYLERDTIDMEKDMVSYRQAGFFASDDEVRELLRKLSSAIAEVMANEPAPHRRKRTLTSILLPDS